ncbi:class I SAM-dependent methyltransferase [Kutzneria kofuensis]|uniref:SAM-dependent methyltransferase n=1 Tax=Kutzneria kofuensis TaxID=103725 RepID=A0A7W9NEC7_9PSEU|nr:class I SAM-dependent methyltransferase [Kutzneria kofuensis]MBB5890182.1 SAM-dependent methyltransferase [Kutzneria kofuensis]
MVETYASGPFSAEQPTEAQRLRMLERFRDPDTFAILESLPVKESWRCLEIGAGTGSVTRWLADRCSHVVAADLDVRHLEPAATVSVLETDITAHSFPTASFDLIHARAVMCHLPARDEVVARALDWLAPGGWFVVEDIYTLPVGSSPYPAMNAYAKAAFESATARGADMQWGTRLPGIMAQLGYVDVHVETKPRMIGLGGLADDLWRMNLRQAGPHLIAKGLFTPEALDECLALIDDPAFVDVRYIGISVWARKAG